MVVIGPGSTPDGKCVLHKCDLIAYPQTTAIPFSPFSLHYKPRGLAGYKILKMKVVMPCSLKWVEYQLYVCPLCAKQ